MNTLAEQLLKAGVATREQFDKVSTEKAATQINAPAVTKDNVNNLRILERSRSIREFKEIAKGLLLRDIHLIKDVVQKAHDLYKGQDGDKKLFYILYQVRDNLEKFPKDDHAQIIKRAFRKCGATVEVPISLKKKRK